MRFIALILLSLLAYLPAAQALTLHVTNGKLTGASNVEVLHNSGVVLYDVEFLDGSCIQLFNGCDQASDFVFPDALTASQAANAFYSVLLLDGPAGAFGTQPGLTNGCSLGLSIDSCQLLVPYALAPFGNARVILTTNTTLNIETTGLIDSQIAANKSTADLPGTTYARFTLVPPTAVPTPGVLSCLALGIFVLLGVRRCRQNGGT